MSGGGSSKATTQAAQAVAADPQLAQRVIPAFMPGQQGLLAQQLSAGGYGTPDEWTGLLGGMYSDMNLPVINGAQDIAALKKMNAAAAKAGTTSGGAAAAADPWARTVGGSNVYDGSWAGPVTGGFDR